MTCQKVVFAKVMLIINLQTGIVTMLNRQNNCLQQTGAFSSHGI